MIFTTDKFVEVDTILRRGGHVNRSELRGYEFICENYEQLRSFYERYQCSLVQHGDGFFYLLSVGNLLPARQLSKPCMHLGMFIAMKAKDPEITRLSGRIAIKQLFQAIETTVSPEILRRIYAPKQRDASKDAKIADEITKALKTLEALNFITVKDDLIRPTEAIERFASLARHDNNPDPTTREYLIARQGVVFHEAEDESKVIEDEDETVENQ